jgi:hypothetical protein
VLEKVRIVFRVAAVDEKAIDLSLASDFKYLEDAVQCYSAVNAKANCLITRNKRDYVTVILPILTPEEFLVAIAD